MIVGLATRPEKLNMKIVAVYPVRLRTLEGIKRVAMVLIVVFALCVYYIN